MGCGQSQVQPAGGDERPAFKSREQNGGLQNGHAGKGDSERFTTTTTDSNANWTSKETVPKSVAFSVTLEGEPIENKLLGPPPSRLKRLEPLGLPRLTAEELAEKQIQADEKREQQLERRVKSSVKSSRQRHELQMARELDNQKQAEHKIHESLKSAGLTREANLNKIKDKQRIRDDRRLRAREKVRKLNELDQDVDIEKDETYNAADEGDSWINDEIPDDGESSSENGEKIYDGGRTSPKKRFHAKGKSSVHRGVSETTIDSFDNAYSRLPPSASRLRTRLDACSEKDDFFDS